MCYLFVIVLQRRAAPVLAFLRLDSSATGTILRRITNHLLCVWGSFLFSMIVECTPPQHTHARTHTHTPHTHTRVHASSRCPFPLPALPHLSFPCPLPTLPGLGQGLLCFRNGNGPLSLCSCSVSQLTWSRWCKSGCFAPALARAQHRWRRCAPHSTSTRVGCSTSSPTFASPSATAKLCN